MKHFVEITSIMGSKHFPITLNSLNLYIFEDVSCDAVDAFAESLDIKHPELLRTVIECSINEGNLTEETFKIEDGDIANFTYNLLSCEDCYTAYEDCGTWFVEFKNEGEVTWTENHETIEELKIVYGTMMDLGLFEFA